MSDPGQTARVAYKDLCLDVTDLAAASTFVGPLLGLAEQERRPTTLRLGDGVAAHTVWLNLVDEPIAVRNRVHLDVDVAAVEDVVTAGARVVDDRQPWTVLEQGQAGVLCAFVRPPERLRDYRLYELVVDCADARTVATWWAQRFGVELGDDGEELWVEGGSLPWAIVFGDVPEPKRVKNRVHFDVVGTTADLLDVGATLLRARDDEIGWDVLADPEGNEFCVFATDRPGPAVGQGR